MANPERGIKLALAFVLASLPVACERPSIQSQGVVPLATSVQPIQRPELQPPVRTPFPTLEPDPVFHDAKTQIKIVGW